MRNGLKMIMLLTLLNVWTLCPAAEIEFDIHDWDFAQEGPRVVEGDWMFFWKRHFSPEEIRAERFLEEKSVIVRAPGGLWRQMPAPIETHGWATYIMKIKGLDVKRKPLSLIMSQFMGTHQTWIYWPDSQRLEPMGSSGVNATNEQDFIPQYKMRSTDIPEGEAGDAWLIIAVSSFIADGGLLSSPRLADREMQRHAQRSHEWEVFLVIGMFGMLMLMNFSLFLLRPEDKPSLLMMVIAGIIVIRFIGTEGIAFELYSKPDRTFSLVSMASIVVSVALGFCCYFEFLYRSFPGFISRRGINASWLLTLVIYSFGLVWTRQWMTLSLILWICLCPLGAWMFWGLIRAYRKGVRSSLYALIGVGVFIATVFFDFLVYMNFVSFHYLGQFGMIGFVFMQSLVVAYNFARAFRTAERLSHHLRQEVDRKTERLLMQKEKLEEQKRELVQAHDSLRDLNRFIATHVLQRFLPPDLVEDLVAGKARFDDAAQLRTVTMLFADLCGFTQWTERLGPERISRILNSFLVGMTEVIFSQGGTIDKFMGDGILVMFGAPRAMEPEVQAEAAVRCAALMHEALEQLSSGWQETEGMTFQMRIGIHHGPAVVGSFGGKRRSDYTAVGNTVNIASRVETCAHPGETLVTPAMLEFLPSGQWESAGAFKLKGIEGEMELFRLRVQQKTGQGAA